MVFETCLNPLPLPLAFLLNKLKNNLFNDRCGDAGTTFSLDAFRRGSSSSQMTLNSDFDFVDIIVPSQNGF